MRDLLSKLDAIISETQLNPNDPKGDYEAKKKSLQDLENDPVAAEDPDIVAAIDQRKADLEKEAKQKGVVENFEIGDEFGISFSEDHEISTTIVDILEDGIVIELDDIALEMMTNEGLTFLEGEVVNEEKQKGLDGKACWKGYKRMGTKMKGGKRVDNCVKMGEDHGPENPNASYNVGEYDREGDMAKDDLRTINDAAKELYSIIQADENLPEWVQAKIVKAMDYLDTARDYMKANKYAEDTEVDEAKKPVDNFNPDDIQRLMTIDDLPTLKAQAFELISKPSQKPMKPEKISWFKNALERMVDKKAVIKLMYDLLLSGEGHGVIGSKNSMAQSSYRRRFTDDIDVDEAKYQGREVPLGKKMAGDVKKSKVYVRKPNGNIVKVNFGDKKMRIKKSNPARRKSFRARHNCANPGPRHKARYWSCRSW